MKADGSILIDTKIVDGGMEKGFKLIKDEMSSVGITAKKVGEQIQLSFSKMDVSKPIANAVAKVEQLERKLAQTNLDYDAAHHKGGLDEARKIAAKRIAVYDSLEAARERLSIELAHAVQKEATAEEKAAQRAIRAAEKETAAKQRETKKQIKTLTKSTGHFGSRLRAIVSGAFIFNVISAGLRQVTSYFGTALKANTEFSASFAKMKGALLTAFQPIYEMVLPALLTMMRVLTSLVQVVGSFFAAVAGKTTAQMVRNAKALNKEASAISGVGNAAEKASKQLAGFDEINRLESMQAGSGSGLNGTGTIFPDFSGLDVDKYSEMIDRFLVPLQKMDFTALRNSLSGLGDSFSRVGAIIKDSLEWAWFEILVPLSEWTIEEAAPEAVSALASSLGMVSEVLGPVVDGLKQFWEWIQPIVDFIQDTVVLVIQKWHEAFDELAQVFREHGPEISGTISNIGETLAIVWDSIRPTMEKLRNLFGDVFSKVVELVGKSVGKIIEILYDLSVFINGFVSGDWQRAWDGFKNVVQNSVVLIKDIFLGLWNLVVEIVNGILQAIYDVLVKVDRFFSGGTSSGSSNKRTAATYAMERSVMGAQMPFAFTPQIPALAKGAVLPPNKPFLAMVGDQHSGTNVEAPLSTIQEAVRMEIGSQLQTTNELLQRILEKETDVLLDGDKVGQSVSAYQRRMARAMGY